MYTFHRKQNIPLSLEEAWKFLSDPKNLSLLTPKEMNIKIINKSSHPLPNYETHASAGMDLRDQRSRSSAVALPAKPAHATMAARASHAVANPRIGPPTLTAPRLGSR